jgi:3-hydroxyisobutyrate dehydrogenase
MAGSVHDAREGTLTFLTGGEREALSAVEPALLLFGKGCVYFGELGSANTAKLALNLLVGLMAQGLAEASSIVRHAGLPLREFLEVLGRSGLSSPLYARAGMRYLDQDFNPRFSLHNLRKDMRYANELAAQLGVSGPLMRSLGEQLESLSGAELSLDYSYLLARVLKT